MRGVLCINARNLKYITAHNTRKAIQLADDKLYTKEILAKVGIPTPKLYAVIRDRRELGQFDWNLPDDFVLKPNAGFGGEGSSSSPAKKVTNGSRPVEKQSANRTSRNTFSKS